MERKGLSHVLASRTITRLSGGNDNSNARVLRRRRLSRNEWDIVL